MSFQLMHETQEFRSPREACLRVLGGQVWITRVGDPDDHVLTQGQSLAVGRGERLWLSAWQPGQSAQWDIEPAARPARYALLRAALALVLGVVVRALRGAAAGLEALARSAASTANRAQGCIKAGDSIASAGQLQ